MTPPKTDPALIRAARGIVRARQVAEKQHDPLSDQELDAYVREETKGAYGYEDAKKLIGGFDTSKNLSNLLRSGLQGATFGLSDEIVGLTEGEAEKERVRLANDLFKQAHPAADIVSGIVGGFVSPVAKLLPGGSLTAKGAVARGAVTGAASGAVAGAGSGEGLRDRASRAATGAVGGGLLGMLFPGLAAVYRGARNPGQVANRMLDEAIEKSGGSDALARKAQDFASLGRGDEVTLADLSPHLADKLDFAVNINPAARVAARDVHRVRQADMTTRLLEDVKRVVGDPSLELMKEGAKTATRAFGNSAEGFAGLRAANPEINGDAFAREFQPFINQAPIQKALAEAKATGAIGIEPDMGKPSFQNIQDAKEALDDAVSHAFANSRGNLGTRLKEVRDFVKGFLERNVENYPEVAAKYGSLKKLERAIDSGAHFWNQVDEQALKQATAGLTEGELDNFRQAMAAKLIEQLRSASTNRNEANRLLQGGKDLQQKLELILGPEYKGFLARATAERTMAETSGRAVGGSQTAYRQAEQGVDPLEAGIGAAIGGPGAVLGLGAQQAVKAGKKEVMRKAGDELAQMLLVRGTPALDKFLEAFAKRPPLVGPTATVKLPLAASSLFDQFRD